MEKDSEAWKVMEDYNKEDVRILEGIYDAYKPWIKNHPNASLYGGEPHTCPACGSSALTKRGYSYTSASKFQRFVCTDCGTWSRDRKGIQQVTLVTDKT